MNVMAVPLLENRIPAYVETLAKLVAGTAATAGSGASLPLPNAFDWVIRTARESHDAGNKLIFVGNGGSAGICSHMATDYSKNGNLRSLALNDGSMLTCLGNDYGYEHVFSKQIEFHARAGDLLVAISSSGKSANILNAVQAARAARCKVVTFSGFTPENPLRKSGDMNFFIASGEYGFVEVGHLTLCHAILDLSLGWGVAQTDTTKG